ncbi:UDP-N-acetylenolpyruvoylglucosamine reductase [Candidatus Saccharibacteria bacterium RIFCSPHIGHO2_01_FULL_45_15]|nr:MAG: UDP-N-acetylenolpyruvoylglucosamine reductase [Candidatus Saccharibacteria bacterium RIFCSPHIGHO2_01_FULL_45_15]OGL27043.1 MAG: UDP-N-acetylenolpyruvoylglucosamine reductase [Candidatus Saccharibacteria bacterium RIFCSPHIGHO2_02_FULL_46_12]OGL31853.1 MAG: UDP-N-acetylenolpyruvoylglucosamine reductase [Candidatus Saccharibacteria bacterium RIFCSPHIGHO2_12_FULL_44_22]
MDIKTNIPLSTLTTMRLGGPARFFAEASTVEQLVNLYRNAKKLQQPVTIIGGGSNIIAHDEGFNGLIIRNGIKGFEVVADDGDTTTFKIGGGENWDNVVQRTVKQGLSGIETLSAIPGTTGAAPVQNIGAYGQEIADTFISLEAYDSENDTLVELDWQDCSFSYRHSIFRGSSQGRYAITSITLKLYKKNLKPPFYSGLQRYLDENNISEYTPQAIRTAIIAIRGDKLPDPQFVANSGSFFKNAIVETWQYTKLQEQYDDIPGFKMDDNHYKIPTGWLIEEAGLKGDVINGIKIHTGNALVLINESASSYADLANARDSIISAVRDKFQVVIEQEPLEI